MNMKKIKTTVLPFFLAAGILVGSASAAFSPAVDVNTDPKGAYNEMMSYYLTFYRNDYVSCYQAYNASLSDLASQISAADLQTEEQVAEVFAFLNGLVADKHAFFGNRETPNTSRYDVPYYRNATHEAASNQEYAAAYNYGLILIDEVQQRINFLNQLKANIDAYEIPGPGDDPVEPDVYMLQDDDLTMGTTASYKTYVMAVNTRGATDIAIPVTAYNNTFSTIVTITQIYQDVFRTKGLTSVTFSSGGSLTRIHARAFMNNSLTEVTLPNTVTTIDYGAFMDNPIDKVTIGSGVTLASKVFRNSDTFLTAYAAGGAGTYDYVGGSWIKQ